MKKSIVKLGVSLAAGLMIGSSAVGLTSVKADTINTSFSEETINNNVNYSPQDIDGLFDKSTEPNLLLRKNGVNGVSAHWNYARIYIDKNTANLIKGGGMGAAGFLAGKIPNAYVKFGAATVMGVLGVINVRGGIWIDFNYAYGVTSWGWQ